MTAMTQAPGYLQMPGSREPIPAIVAPAAQEHKPLRTGLGQACQHLG